MSDPRPNFLVFFVDQMRADHMGCAGNPIIQTPRLDQLARDGVLMSRAYVSCPLCMPDRATFFTGLTPRGHRVRTNGIPLDPAFPTMPGALAAAGYRTASMGKIHVTNYGLHQTVSRDQCPPDRFQELADYWKTGEVTHVQTPFYGLDDVILTIGHGAGVLGDYRTWLRDHHPDALAKLDDRATIKPSPLKSEGCGRYPIPEALHHTRYVADRTIDYLNTCRESEPFFLICSFPDPHHPYVVSEPWDAMYSPDDVVPPVMREGELDDLAPLFRDIYENTGQLSGRVSPTKMPIENRREILAYTYGMVSLLDMHIGRVLDALDARGLADNTVVLFLSDHGDMMGDHGLLNKGPFHFDGLLRIPMIWRFPSRFTTQTTPALASMLDVPVTILDLAGVPIPEGLSSPEARLQPPAWPGRSLKPVLFGDADTVQDSVVIENDEDYLGLRLRTLITESYKITTYTSHRGPEPYGELFDRINDPDELRNLWNSPDHVDIKKDLTAALHYRLTETDIAVPRRISHA